MQISLFRIFLIFLKTGAIAFGGNIALVAAVRKELCEKRKILSDDYLLDITTVGNVLPGPLASNVVTACGFAMRGMTGAIVALTGILLPAFILVCGLSELYFRYGQNPIMGSVFSGLLPGVAAVIAYTAWVLARKSVKNVLQLIILVVAGALVLLLKGALVTLGIVVVSGLLGYFFLKRSDLKPLEPTHVSKRSYWPIIMTGVMFAVGFAVLFYHPVSLLLQELRMLSLTFSSMSVTLFGGGYVFIPAIEKVVVGMHGWVTSKEFADGIAMGQITPGPIAITAAFVGYKVSGIWGALVSTISIFVPPAMLMLIAQQFLGWIKRKPVVEFIFRGIRPAVIGMIIVSVWVIGKNAPHDWQSIFIFASMFGFCLWKNPDTAVVVTISGVLGFLLHLI
ncbi:MAG TPA: chromate efflux transporter [Bacteroidia bacterium]|jgi:chromate transporter|nr:chromate efflux transporter [Bacteroidia bacterium]